MDYARSAPHTDAQPAAKAPQKGPPKPQQNFPQKFGGKGPKQPKQRIIRHQGR